jgi:hypothetical protein
MLSAIKIMVYIDEIYLVLNLFPSSPQTTPKPNKINNFIIINIYEINIVDL